MSTNTSTHIDTNTYFEDIGAWPKDSRHMPVAYVTGLIFSLVLTFGAYFLAVHHILSVQTAMLALIALACIQFAAQIMFFLHLGKEAASRDRLIVLSFVILIIVILVSGSVWIMYSLNSRMMPSTEEMEQYMNNQQGL